VRAVVETSEASTEEDLQAEQAIDGGWWGCCLSLQERVFFFMKNLVLMTVVGGSVPQPTEPLARWGRGLYGCATETTLPSGGRHLVCELGIKA
jgi:hypothetical protein